MKHVIIVLLVFTAIFCYSQATFSDTKKVASNSVSIKQFKELKNTVDKLVASNKKLQSDKDVLENKLELQSKQNLTAIEIVNTAESAYNNRVNDIQRTADFIYYFVSIGIVIILFLLGIHVWRISVDSRKVNKLKTGLDDTIETFNGDLAMSNIFLGKRLSGYDACCHYFNTVFYGDRTKKQSDYYINSYGIQKKTLDGINGTDVSKLASLKTLYETGLEDTENSIASRRYYRKCLGVIENRINIAQGEKKK